jgi:hypothetical protein
MQDIVRGLVNNRHQSVATALGDTKWRSHLFINVSTLCLVVSVTFTTPAHAAERQLVHDHAVKVIAEFGLQPVGALPDSTNLDLVIGLPLRNQEALTNLMQRQYEPSSPQ